MAEMGERVELVNGEVCDDERLNSENGVCLTCSAGGQESCGSRAGS